VSEVTRAAIPLPNAGKGIPPLREGEKIKENIYKLKNIKILFKKCHINVGWSKLIRWIELAQIT